MQAAPSLEQKKELVRRYFAEIIDGRADVLEQIFFADCVIHRHDLPEPIRGVDQLAMFLEMSRYAIARTETTIHHLIAEGDLVVARLSHRATMRGEVLTPFGACDAAGKAITWSAMAMFRFEAGKIAEEWVLRDELGMLVQLGVLKPHS